MATTSADAKCSVWRTKDFSHVIDLTDQNQRWVWDLAFSGDSKLIVTGKESPSPPIRGSSTPRMRGAHLDGGVPHQIWVWLDWPESESFEHLEERRFSPFWGTRFRVFNWRIILQNREDLTSICSAQSFIRNLFMIFYSFLHLSC